MNTFRAEEFRESESVGWQGDESAKKLFEVRRKLRQKCLKIHDKPNNEERQHNVQYQPDETSKEDEELVINDLLNGVIESESSINQQ